MSFSVPDARRSFDLTLENQTLWLGTLDLHDDHLSISGWSWTGPLQEDLPFDHIYLVERWPPTRNGPNFVIYRKQSSALHCKVDGGAFYLANVFKKKEGITLKRKH